jgi:hypothetical protein
MRTRTKQRLWIFVGVALLLYVALGATLRRLGILHPYWGRYILVAPAKGPREYSRVIAHQTPYFRPIYWLECLVTVEPFLHDDRRITGTLPEADIRNTFGRVFFQPMPKGIRVRATSFSDIQYLDMMKRDIVFDVLPSHLAEFKKFLETARADANSSEEDEFDIEEVWPLRISETVLGTTFDAGSSEFRITAPDYGTESDARMLASPDGTRWALHWEIND